MDLIIIEGMKFYAHHGYYKEERKTGNHFVVDVEVKLNYTRAAENDSIIGTIDYVKIFKICEKEMKKTKKLLETVGYCIGERIKSKFKGAKKVKVKISKLNPPLDVKTDRFTVVYKT